MYKLLTVLVALLLGGCMIRSNKENLQDALLKYNAAVRWGRTEWMTELVQKEKRSTLMVNRREFGDLQVTGCQVGEVNVKGSNKALAVVRVDWYLVRSGRLHTSFIEQTWKREGERWFITKQRLVRGAPCPLFTPKPSREQSRPAMT
jgi:hypothetical protein